MDQAAHRVRVPPRVFRARPLNLTLFDERQLSCRTHDRLGSTFASVSGGPLAAVLILRSHARKAVIENLKSRVVGESRF